LIIKDDNVLLPEWLAYHYAVMPLRHLVVAADPLSLTSPKPILDAFKEQLPDFSFDLWTGNHYWIEGRWTVNRIAQFDPYNHTREHAFGVYIQRQRAFYTRCMQHLKDTKHDRHNTTWAAIFDTDEYFTFNPILPMEEKEHVNVSAVRQSVPRFIGAPNQTIAHWMDSHQNLYTVSDTDACLYYPRYFIQATPDDETNTTRIAQLQQQSKLAAAEFPIQRFSTLHYQYHTNPYTSYRWINGKSILRIDQYDGKTLLTNPHRPLGKELCIYHGHKTTPLKFYQYTGSLEVWMSSFPRREISGWLERNHLTIAGTDPSLSQWLHYFVDFVGPVKAKQLTVDLWDQAMAEAKQIQQRLLTNSSSSSSSSSKFNNNNNTSQSIPYAFPWDPPPLLTGKGKNRAK
jgi:hypothetical protein